MTSNGAQPEIQTGMLKSHPHVPQQQVDRAGGQEKLQMIERVSVNNIHGQREARKIKQGRETLSEYTWGKFMQCKYAMQQEAHGPHHSPEKTVQINKHI